MTIRWKVNRTIAIAVSALLLSSLTGCGVLQFGARSLLPGPRVSEFVLETPPVDLPASGAHGTPASQSIVTPVAVPVDGWLHGFSFDVVDSAGADVPKPVVHHISLRDPKKRDLFAPVMLRVIAAGQETGTVRLPTVVGYPFFRRDSLLLMAMLHNPTGQSYKGVRVRLRITHSIREGRSPVVVYPFAVHVVDPNGPSDFDVPPGRSEQSWTVRPAVAGRVLGFGGHLHRYGIGLRFEDVTAGRILYQTSAQLDSAGNVLRIPRRMFYLSGGVRLRPDHEYRVTAIYQNPTGVALPGAAMGIVAGLFQPDGSTWPASDPADRNYIVNLQRQFGHSGSAGHSHDD